MSLKHANSRAVRKRMKSWLPVNDLARLVWPGPVGLFARLRLAGPVDIDSSSALIGRPASNSQPGRGGNLA
eukprot:8535915-Karenia_brevis.AAC.1